MYQAIMDRVIVRLCEQKQALFTANIEDKYRNRGTVLSVGEAVRDVKAGDKIIFHRFDDLPLGQKDIVVVREKSILGIIDESD